ncbi:MAG: hypothetical protein E7240_05470 [Lachnospiraceae bacterium]|nr:hypothetical protein [Lachnospiraceae bacterium]
MPLTQYGDYPRIIGTDDQGMVWIKSGIYEENMIVRLDPSDGSLKEYPLGEGYMDAEPKVRGDSVYYIMDGIMMKLTEKEGITSSVTLEDEDTFRYFSSFYISPDSDSAVVSESFDTDEEEDRKTAVLVDLKSGRQTELDAEFDDFLEYAVWNGKKNRIAVTDGYSIALCASDGKAVKDISLTGEKVVSMSFYKDQLLVLFSGGFLNRYRALDGTSLGQTSVSYYSTESFDEGAEWGVCGDSLYIFHAVTGGGLLNYLDPVSFEESASAINVLTFDAERDRIITYSTDINSGETALGYFPHYSVEELLQKGKEALGDFALSGEERSRYGLE